MKSELKALRETLKSNIGIFGKIAMPTAYKKETPPFHNEIYEVLGNKDYKRVLIAAPRSTAKSTIVSLVLPVYEVMHKKPDEDLFIVIVSESRSQAVNFLSRIKNHLERDDTIRDIYGNFGEETAFRWREDDIILKNGARIVAIGTRGRIRGFLEGDTRPNLLILDDIESETNAATGEARVKNRKWVTEAVIPSLADNGRVVMIGTVISEDCFLYWARDSSAWKTLWYSIIDENGKSIWEDKFPLSRIEEIKNDFVSVGNLNGFFQEYMNEAQAPDNAPFKPEFIKLHHYSLKKDLSGEWYLESGTLFREENEIKRIPVDLYQGVDPASSLSEKADYFVITTLALDHEGNVYVVDVLRDRIPPAKQPRVIINKFKQFRPKKMKIETVAYQEALRDSVKALMQEEKIYIPGLEKGVKPRNSKSERLLSLVPLLAGGKFYFRPMDIEMQKEFLSYPKGKYDDSLDSIWTALQGAVPCRRKEISNIPKEKKKKKLFDWRVL